MPFNRILDTSLRPKPAIRVFFHGLVVLHSPAGSNWFAEVLKGVSNHTLSVEVRAKEPDQPDQILLRHHGPLNGPDPGLRITTAKEDGTPDTSPVVANKFTPAGSFPVPNPSGVNRLDFRWALNFEHSDYHNARLRVKPAKTRPGIEVAGGQSYLYTAILKEGPIERTQGPTAKPSLHGLASVIGANLYLEDGTVALVTLAGVTPPLRLPKPAANSNLYYEIYVNNSPLFATTEHDEMAEYYNVIEEDDGDDIPGNQQFKLKIPGPPPQLSGSAKIDLDPFRASIRIPCMPGTLDGPG